MVFDICYNVCRQEWKCVQAIHKAKASEAVSYTHLDVYKRQLDGWDKTNDKNENLGYFDVSEKSFILRDTEDITLKANWKPNAKYLYTPSKYTNSYNITDDNNKEISFKFYVDGKQEKEEDVYKRQLYDKLWSKRWF